VRRLAAARNVAASMLAAYWGGGVAGTSDTANEKEVLGDTVDDCWAPRDSRLRF
jgi:hypothetical protein